MKIDIIKNILDKMSNKELWGFVGGAGTGSVISLCIGEKLKRDKAIANVHLSKDVRFYEGEFRIFIECSWRVMSANKIICTSKDSNEKNGPMLKGLNSILNHRILSVEIEEPTLDLRINLENQKSLFCFCDESDEDPDYTDYLIFYSNKIYAIGSKGKLAIERSTYPRSKK